MEHKVLEHVALIYVLCVKNHEHPCSERLVFSVLSADLVQGETEHLLIH